MRIIIQKDIINKVERTNLIIFVMMKTQDRCVTNGAYIHFVVEMVG